MGLFDTSVTSVVGTAKRLEIAVASSTAGGIAPPIRTINLPTSNETTATNTGNDFTGLSAKSALTTFQRSTQAVATVPATSIPTAQSIKAVATKVLKDQEAAREAIIASIYSSLFSLISVTANAGLFSVNVKLAEKQYSELNQVLVKYGYTIASTGNDSYYTVSWA